MVLEDATYYKMIINYLSIILKNAIQIAPFFEYGLYNPSIYLFKAI